MLAWHQLIRGLGYSIELIEVFQGYILSFLPRYIPGTVWGYWSRGEWLKQSYGIPYADSTFSSLLEIGLWLLTSTVAAAGCYLWEAWLIPLWLLAIPGLLVIPWLAWASLRVITTAAMIKRLVGRWGPEEIRFDFSHWLLAYLIYLVFWLCYGFSLVQIVQGLGHTQAGLAQTTLAYSLAWLVGFVILIAPTGLGVRELMLSSLLAHQFNLLPELASAIAVTSRFTIYLAEVIWLLLGLALSRMRTKKAMVLQKPISKRKKSGIIP
jgi:hypothetical protein